MRELELALEAVHAQPDLSLDGLGALDAALGSPLDSSPALFHLVWGSQGTTGRIDSPRD